jgi:hypothetical protein
MPRPLVPRSFTISKQSLPRQRPLLWYPILRSATAALATIVLVSFMVTLVEPVQTAAPKLPAEPATLKATAEVAASPAHVAVDPAETRRSLPTATGRPSSIQSLPTCPPTISIAGGYPVDTTPAPWIEVTGVEAVPEESAASPAAQSAAALRVVGLSLLGLLAGATWLAYQVERPFI